MWTEFTQRSGGTALVLESMILYSLAVRYGKWQRRSMIDETPSPLDHCVEVRD